MKQVKLLLLVSGWFVVGGGKHLWGLFWFGSQKNCGRIAKRGQCRDSAVLSQKIQLVRQHPTIMANYRTAITTYKRIVPAFFFFFFLPFPLATHSSTRHSLLDLTQQTTRTRTRRGGGNRDR